MSSSYAKMGLSGTTPILPASDSLNIHLSHPTSLESLAIWKLTSNVWNGALTAEQYIEEAAYLLTVPLNRDGGMTQWVLVDRTLPPDQRPVLASCETIRKRCYVQSSDGTVREGICHGVASVFCHPGYRERGYASRMMRELNAVLRNWQGEERKVAASVLFSDIGKRFYTEVGWRPFPSVHVEFQPVMAQKKLDARLLVAEDLKKLCEEDEVMVLERLARMKDGKVRMALIPDEDSMLWFHKKEEFLAVNVYKKPALVKGAISGERGNRVWVIWDRFCHGPIGNPTAGNTLYILRLVIEGHEAEKHELQVKHLKAVLQAAQAEAIEWGLSAVELWNPNPAVEYLIEKTGLQHRKIDREEDEICSLLWYGEGSGQQDTLVWYGNDKFGWL